MIRLILIAVISYVLSCKIDRAPHIEEWDGLYKRTTVLIDKNRDTTFNYPLLIWYSDSCAIEEVISIGRITDTNDITTIVHDLQFCRLLDLRKDSMYDFSSRSDTAQLLRRLKLPDSIMTKGGWPFYSKKTFVFKDDPIFIGDTTINGETWKLGYFEYTFKSDRIKHRRLGFFKCGEPYTLFALEHGHYERSGCRLDRYLDFWNENRQHTGDTRIERLTTSLPDSIRHLFTAWKQAIAGK